MTLTMLLVSLTTFSNGASADELKHIQKVDGGYLLTDENIISLANYIQELQAENTRLQALVDATTEALRVERELTERLIAEKDNLIELQKIQIDELKFLYENSKPSVFDKAELLLGGAGVAAAIIFLSQIL